MLARKYPLKLIEAAIEKARKVPRKLALKKVEDKRQTMRPVFALTYDPRLPSINNIKAKHWRSMKNKDQYLADVLRASTYSIQTTSKYQATSDNSKSC